MSGASIADEVGGGSMMIEQEALCVTHRVSINPILCSAGRGSSVSLVCSRSAAKSRQPSPGAACRERVSTQSGAREVHREVWTG